MLEAVDIAEAVTQMSSYLGLSVALAPRYLWAEGEMSSQLKYSTTKLKAKGRYSKPTKAQLQRGEARRGLEAAKGILPFPGVSQDVRKRTLE